MRRSIILHSARALSASWAQPRCNTISKMARISRAADCVMKTMSDTSAKPSSFSWEMYACNSTFTCTRDDAHLAYLADHDWCMVHGWNAHTDVNQSYNRLTDWLSQGFTSHPTQNRQFQRCSSQPIAWLSTEVTKSNTTKSNIHP